MKPFVCCATATAWFAYSIAATTPSAIDSKNAVTYSGIYRNDIEAFLNIPYGQDTSGEHRFKPPRPYIPTRGSTIHADSYGPTCPQQLGHPLFPLFLSDVTKISEDCLNLNVARPKGTCAKDRLPVMVFLHGGGFKAGQNSEITNSPDGLVLESVKNGLPIIHVAMNYRVGVFGFAQSSALKAEGSENAGLRDQRLAIEWVRDNIENFGGDPEKITIFGQSSGGVAVGLQMLAYGGSKPVPFQKGICESQVLEPGITGTFTIDAMKAVVDFIGCNKTDLNAEATVSCLRNLDTQSLLNAQLTTYSSIPNLGDIWLPVVDGDFLPAAPSQLVKEGRFAKSVTTMFGWCQDDTTLLIGSKSSKIKTADDTKNFITGYLSNVSSKNIDKLLSLYSVSDFNANKDGSLSSEFYRSARIFRDVAMTCQPIYYGARLAAAGNEVYLFNWNQTMFDPILATLGLPSGFGPIHTSELAYVNGNLSHYKLDGFPFHPTESDNKLMERGSRTWSTFASVGKPGLKGHNTFQGFTPAFANKNEVDIFVAGGPHEGLSSIDGSYTKSVLSPQRLRERCAFINSPEMIEQLRY